MAQGEQLHISTWPAVWPTRRPAAKSTSTSTQDMPLMQARYVTGILDVCRRCVGVLIGSVLTRTRQYFVPCAYMHAVVPPASSHARLTLDWLAISRALPVHHRSCAGVSLPRMICAWRLGTLFLATKTSSSIIQPPGSRTALARRRCVVCHQRR